LHHGRDIHAQLDQLAGAVTMADAHSRFKGLGVALTSTGAGAGNAVGSLIEAMNTPRPLKRECASAMVTAPASPRAATKRIFSRRPTDAGSPVLHLTGQVEREYLDRDASFIHETKDQLTFLRAALPAPAPVLVNATPRPLKRECASAMVTAPASPRAATKRIFMVLFPSTIYLLPMR
jgi:acetolactate synthase-1/2/3 large subunit